MSQYLKHCAAFGRLSVRAFAHPIEHDEKRHPSFIRLDLAAHKLVRDVAYRFGLLRAEPALGVALRFGYVLSLSDA
jgi:hypothetical protein